MCKVRDPRGRIVSIVVRTVLTLVVVIELSFVVA
jgi:hypothetical protein